MNDAGMISHQREQYMLGAGVEVEKYMLGAGVEVEEGYMLGAGVEVEEGMNRNHEHCAAGMHYEPPSLWLRLGVEG